VKSVKRESVKRESVNVRPKSRDALTSQIDSELVVLGVGWQPHACVRTEGWMTTGHSWSWIDVIVDRISELLIKY